MRYRRIFALALVGVVSAARAGAQGGMAGMPMGGADSANPAVQGVNEQMSGMIMDSPHMRMTPLGAPKPGDAARADAIVSELRGALGKYSDYKVALAEGYRIFMPGVKQKVYHFTNFELAVQAAFGFDATKPTSLLYEKTGDGYKLVGAMYTAPRTMTEAELDQRVPLSVAQWHVHVNLCIPQKGERARWREMDGGKPKFGPKGTISTKADCDAAGGRFIPQLFGWMVHVQPWETDPGKVWGRHEGHGHDE